MSIMDLITAKTITRICWIVINLSYLTTALKDVYVTVPAAVKKGDNATLICRYDLEKDTLYSIKWYKGRREFYRYTPREPQPMKVFSVPGIAVERSLSNSSNVILTAVETTTSGKYSCEVSADAPSFHTVIVSSDLEVVDVPILGPTIEGVNSQYSVSDVLTGNCTLSRTKPAANLTWLINNFTALPHQLVKYNVAKEDLPNGGEATTLGLKLFLTSKFFRNNKLVLACRAQIYQIYDQITERIIELDASTTNQILEDNFNTIKNNRHSLYESDVGETHDMFMHHIQADMSSSASTSSSSTSSSSSPKSVGRWTLTNSTISFYVGNLFIILLIITIVFKRLDNMST